MIVEQTLSVITPVKVCLLWAADNPVRTRTSTIERVIALLSPESARSSR